MSNRVQIKKKKNIFIRVHIINHRVMIYNYVIYVNVYGINKYILYYNIYSGIYGLWYECTV